MSRAAFAAHKRRVNASKSFIKVDLGDIGVDVARHGDVDEQQWPAAAIDRVDQRPRDDRFARPGRGQDDVGGRERRGEPVDDRTDTWSLGVVAHELLSGERLFHGKGPALLDQVISGPIPPLQHVPEALSRVVAQMLSRDLHQRPQRTWLPQPDARRLQ